MMLREGLRISSPTNNIFLRILVFHLLDTSFDLPSFLAFRFLAETRLVYNVALFCPFLSMY